MKASKALKAYKIVDSDGYNYPVTKATLLLLLQEQEQEENEVVSKWTEPQVCLNHLPDEPDY